jgi:hypothetical protein
MEGVKLMNQFGRSLRNTGTEPNEGLPRGVVRTKPECIRKQKGRENVIARSRIGRLQSRHRNLHFMSKHLRRLKDKGRSLALYSNSTRKLFRFTMSLIR